MWFQQLLAAIRKALAVNMARTLLRGRLYTGVFKLIAVIYAGILYVLSHVGLINKQLGSISLVYLPRCLKLHLVNR